MTDLFDPFVPDPWLDRIFAVGALARQHTHQFLTKRGDRMRRYVEDPATPARIERAMDEIAPSHWCTRELQDVGGWPLRNIWLGVSVENQRFADARRDDLRAIAALGWTTIVSYEPAIGPVAWTGWEFLAQLISGGGSGGENRPSHPAWHRVARDFCGQHGIAYFFKQWGEFGPNVGQIFAKPFPAASWLRADDGLHLTRERDFSLMNEFPEADWALMFRSGKGRSGRMLDGREWSAFPAATAHG